MFGVLLEQAAQINILGTFSNKNLKHDVRGTSSILYGYGLDNQSSTPSIQACSIVHHNHYTTLT